MSKETNKSKETNNSLFDDIDLKEILETTLMDIKPKYDVIPENDLTTIRRVSIESLPVDKEVNVKGKDMILKFMEINDNGIVYSLPANSIALRRSIVQCAIKLSNAKIQKDIDMSKVIGILLGLKREQFEAKGFTQSPLKFFLLID